MFSADLRASVVKAFVLKMRSLGHRIVACACGAEHLHSLPELPNELADVKREVGKCKQRVSHALRDVLPGSIWSQGGEYKPIRDTEHFQNTYDYIRTKQEPGTVVWSYREEEDWIEHPSLGHFVISDQRELARVPHARV